MFAITFILSELNALQSSLNRITNDNSMNQLNAAQIQTCTNSKIVLGKVKMFCVRGNQTNVFVSHTASFSNTIDFNASILFDASRLDRFVYTGQISYSSQMQMFSLVSSDSLRITSSNITVSQLQCPSAALLSFRGALVLNNSAVSFSHSGQASGGLVFESLDMAVFNVAFACSITASSGGLFAFSASGKLVLDRFSATGAFNVPSPSLVNAGALLTITIRNASAAFFVQSRCASGLCSMTGLLVAGLDPAFSCGSNAEYCSMRQVLFGDYLQKEIVVDGVAVQARCAIEGVQDFNYSYVRVDESVSGAKANSSLFCFRPVFTKMIVVGSYQIAASGSDVSCGSIFMASPDHLVSLQDSKIVVNFSTYNLVNLSIFINQDQNVILIQNTNITLRFQSDSLQVYQGISKQVQTLSIGNCVINYNANNVNYFHGLAQTLIAATVNQVTISMQVNGYYAYGIAKSCYSNAQIYNSVIQGSLNAPVTYGIMLEATGTINLTNITFSLKTTGQSTFNCGFIQYISQTNAVTTSNITFLGFEKMPNIMSQYGYSQSLCPCMANSNLVNGLCYCIDGAQPQVNECRCTQYAQLVTSYQGTKSCVCQVAQTTLTNGICTCVVPYLQIVDNSCSCAVGSVCGTRYQYQTRSHVCESSSHRINNCCSEIVNIPICNCSETEWGNSDSSCTVPSEQIAGETRSYTYNSLSIPCPDLATCGGTKYPSGSYCECSKTVCTQLRYNSCRMLTFTSYLVQLGQQCNCVEYPVPSS
ncbi:Hypothetical_protein [Hexamita inflata]|uniref:Hypothetical_protein n=1 Tax=Hexamita inflata TaxID=28002 RepID=A0AA86NBJ3_9EUKA|nr:Hypothetical protein HINF_LOCUS3920 [Hexamita inflata]